MVVLYSGLLVLITLVFQTTVAEYFLEIAGAKPDFLLMLALALGLMRGKTAGTALGCLLGFLQDALSGGLLGQNALSKGLIGFGAGALRRDLMTLGPLIQAFLLLLATTFDAALNLLLGLLLHPLPGGTEGQARILLSLIALNTLIGPPTLWVLGRLEARWMARPGVKEPFSLRKRG